MQFYPHRTVEEQANRLPEELRDAYSKSQMDRITIFDGEKEIEITGYAEYSFLEEKAYKTQPVRTQDGAIHEIEEYATFLTPRLVIKYNMMHIDDYRSLMKMLKKRNGFIVKCYDVVEDEIVRNEMYVATPSMPIIYQQYLIALGIQEYAIELIGTNAKINPSEGENGTTKFTFQISLYPYKARFGQTWRDWVNSESGKDFRIDESNNLVVVVGSPKVLIKKDGDNREYVSPDDYITYSSYYDLI